MDPDQLSGWLVDAGVRTVVLCGGGEPLDEPQFCERVLRNCGRSSLNLAVYTSGQSSSSPVEPAECIRSWQRLRGDNPRGRFWLRLSLDAFHADRIGTTIVADWIRMTERHAPDWRVSLRMLRVHKDTSLTTLARELGATVRDERGGSARLALRSGRTLTVEKMAYVVDGRGTLGLLQRRGLALPDRDVETLAPWQRLVGRSRSLGRPLSRRLTVSAQRLDIEIHANAGVHVLESQAFDARLSLADFPWRKMRDLYYRDPLIHSVSAGGLLLAAGLLRRAIERGSAPPSIVPFSIERISDSDLLDWLTAATMVALARTFRYPKCALELARQRSECRLEVR